MVYWPSTVNAANYALQYRPFGSSAAYIGIGSTTSNVKVGNLIPGQHYEFRVRAYLASGSPTGAFKTTDYTTTATTYAKSMDMGTASQMSWDDYSPWASTYVFQYKKHTASTWTNVPCYLPYCKMNTDAGVAYDCQVIVYHAGLLYGTTALNTFNANAFTSSVANNTGTALDLTWTNFDLNNPAPWVTTQYLKYRVAGSSNPWGVKLIAGGINTSHMTNLTANTNYEFTVSVYLPAYWGISPVANFSTSTSKELAATNHDVNIYPNPFVNKVNMDLFTEQGTTVTWNIYDMTGKVVLSGSQSITSGYSTLNIDAANLSKGVYMLNAIMNDQIQSFRIMKQ
jgi:hypothetical protein